MEHTGALEVRVDHKIEDLRIAIHPNDGLDLDLFTREHSVLISAGTSIEQLKAGKGALGEGEIHLLNECPVGTLQVSETVASGLCFSSTAMVIRDGKKIFLVYK